MNISLSMMIDTLTMNVLNVVEQKTISKIIVYNVTTKQCY